MKKGLFKLGTIRKICEEFRSVSSLVDTSPLFNRCHADAALEFHSNTTACTVITTRCSLSARLPDQCGSDFKSPLHRVAALNGSQLFV